MKHTTLTSYIPITLLLLSLLIPVTAFPQSIDIDNISDLPIPEAPQNIFITAETDLEDPFWGQAIKLTYKTYIADKFPIQEYDFKSPDFLSFSYYEIDHKSYKNTHKIIEKKGYNVETLAAYWIFPQEHNKIIIPPIAIQTPSRIKDPPEWIASKSITIDVKPLPTPYPPNFKNTNVGTFQLSSTALSPTTIQKADDFNLRLTITGNAPTEKLFIKPLSKENYPKLHETFIILPPQIIETKINTTPNFSSTTILNFHFIAKIETKHTIPPIELTTFDPIEQQYKTLKTDPIEITISGEAPYASERLNPQNNSIDNPYPYRDITLHTQTQKLSQYYLFYLSLIFLPLLSLIIYITKYIKIKYPQIQLKQKINKQKKELIKNIQNNEPLEKIRQNWIDFAKLCKKRKHNNKEILLDAQNAIDLEIFEKNETMSSSTKKKCLKTLSNIGIISLFVLIPLLPLSTNAFDNIQYKLEQRAKLAFNNQDYKTAYNKLEELHYTILQSTPHEFQPDILFNQALILRALNKHDQAIVKFKQSDFIKPSKDAKYYISELRDNYEREITKQYPKTRFLRGESFEFSTWKVLSNLNENIALWWITLAINLAFTIIILMQINFIKAPKQLPYKIIVSILLISLIIPLLITFKQSTLQNNAFLILTQSPEIFSAPDSFAQKEQDNALTIGTTLKFIQTHKNWILVEKFDGKRYWISEDNLTTFQPQNLNTQLPIN